MGPRAPRRVAPRVRSPRWLPVPDIEYIHDLYRARYGGIEGVRDRGVLDASAGRAAFKWKYEEASISECAAAYAFAFATAHAFNDGNKRTAFGAMIAFLSLNGYELDEDDHIALRDAIIRLAMRTFDEEAFALWIAPRLRRRR